jgi:hypothetical protein
MESMRKFKKINSMIIREIMKMKKLKMIILKFRRKNKF